MSPDADDSLIERPDRVARAFVGSRDGWHNVHCPRRDLQPAVYEQRFCRPSWPSATSGITIGVGYDLQFVTADQLRADWNTRLSDEMLTRLTAACRKMGTAALRDQLGDITVPLQAAMSVFASASVPRAITAALGIYPQLDSLPPARRTALVSLVYNRGASLTDSSARTESRREMRAIQALLANGEIDAVADQLESMARLWPTLPGLAQRRRDEAMLWRSGFGAVRLE